MKLKLPAENRIFYIIVFTTLIIAALLIFFYIIHRASNLLPANIKPVIALDEFGIPKDSLTRSEGEINKNETFSKLLYGLEVPANTVQRILSKTAEEMPSNQFKAGMKYISYYTKKEPVKLNYLVFTFDIKKSLIIELNDTVKVSVKIEKEEIVRRTVGLSIHGSLFATLDSLKINENLALELANNIYESQIDFHQLREGDTFKVIYDEININSKPYKIGTIYAAVVNHRNEDYYAFHFVQDNTDEYYDLQANLLRSGFLKAPLSFVRISSHFTYHRMHPILGYSRPHLGTDYAAPAGTPVMSIGDGTVIAASRNGEAGNFIRIKHNSVYQTQYNHLSRYAKGIKKGAAVKKKQIIGYVGMTGLATGPHLDYRLWKNGKLINPLKEKFPSGIPLDKKYKQTFLEQKDKLEKELNSIKIGNSI